MKRNLQAAMNVHDAPADIGFYGAQQQHLWCRTSTEALHFWGWAAAAAEPELDTDVAAQGGAVPPDDALHVSDARTQLTHAVAAASPKSAWHVRANVHLGFPLTVAVHVPCGLHMRLCSFSRCSI